VLVDSHCHLDFPEFAPELDEVVARAGRAGVAKMVTIGTRLSKFAGVKAVAERFADIWCSVGVHPHEAANEPGEDVDRLVAEARHPKVVAIGETGLDYFYDHSPREAQQRSFRAHIRAAAETGLPLIVHARDADEDVARLLEEGMQAHPFTGLLHCFSSGPDLARRALALGMSISLSGIVTFKKADALRAIARELPADRVLVETDAPYLAPVPHRGRRCEPADVVHTARAVATLRGVAPEALAETTTANFHRLFAKVA